MRVRPHLPRRRGWRIVLAVVLVLAFAWAGAAYLVIINPKVDRLQHADAVVVLGGASVDGRLNRGAYLVAHGYAPVLLVSAPPGDDFGGHAGICGTGSVRTVGGGSVPVDCFVPSPLTTQGEAREIRAQAQAHHWHRVIVVTSTYHISRARLIIGRCFSGQVIMTSADPPTLGQWTYNLFYQTGAYAKALLDSSC